MNLGLTPKLVANYISGSQAQQIHVSLPLQQIFSIQHLATFTNLTVNGVFLLFAQSFCFIKASAQHFGFPRQKKCINLSIFFPFVFLHSASPHFVEKLYPYGDHLGLEVSFQEAFGFLLSCIHFSKEQHSHEGCV